MLFLMDTRRKLVGLAWSELVFSIIQISRGRYIYTINRVISFKRVYFVKKKKEKNKMTRIGFDIDAFDCDKWYRYRSLFFDEQENKKKKESK